MLHQKECPSKVIKLLGYLPEFLKKHQLNVPRQCWQQHSKTPATTTCGAACRVWGISTMSLLQWHNPPGHTNVADHRSRHRLSRSLSLHQHSCSSSNDVNQLPARSPSTHALQGSSCTSQQRCISSSVTPAYGVTWAQPAGQRLPLLLLPPLRCVHLLPCSSCCSCQFLAELPAIGHCVCSTSR